MREEQIRKEKKLKRVTQGLFQYNKLRLYFTYLDVDFKQWKAETFDKIRSSSHFQETQETLQDISSPIPNFQWKSSVEIVGRPITKNC